MCYEKKEKKRQKWSVVKTLRWEEREKKYYSDMSNIHIHLLIHTNTIANAWLNSIYGNSILVCIYLQRAIYEHRCYVICEHSKYRTSLSLPVECVCMYGVDECSGATFHCNNVNERFRLWVRSVSDFEFKFIILWIATMKTWIISVVYISKMIMLCSMQ